MPGIDTTSGNGLGADDERSRRERALLDTSLRKSSVVWLRLDADPAGPAHMRWFVWHERRLLLLFGRDEQPDPGLVDGSTVQILVRSRQTRALALIADATVLRVSPADPEWAGVLAHLVAGRLNLVDPADAPRRWASDPDYAVYALEPRLPLVETSEDAPGS